MALPKDAIDGAIAAATHAAAPEMAQFGFQLVPSGRPAGLMMPTDATDEEWLSLISGIVQVAAQVRAARAMSAGRTIAKPPPGLRIQR